ncbi:hypothetical protein [Natribaculum luteum]|uniref:hypothetical protein n=1 Tax=Natribaculum luteum TaxID=1586232 RepID=UPI001FF303DA|nr:hypothetical protein [Natribaculum luteum]
MSRRKVLGVIAATSLTTTGTVAASNPSRKKGSAIRFGVPGDPVELGAIEDIQADAFDRHENVDDEDKIVVEPNLEESREVLAYAQYVDDNGAMWSHFGYGRPDSYYTEENFGLEFDEDVPKHKRNSILRREIRKARESDDDVAGIHDRARAFLKDGDSVSPSEYSVSPDDCVSDDDCERKDGEEYKSSSLISISRNINFPYSPSVFQDGREVCASVPSTT